MGFDVLELEIAMHQDRSFPLSVQHILTSGRTHRALRRNRHMLGFLSFYCVGEFKFKEREGEAVATPTATAAIDASYDEDRPKANIQKIAVMGFRIRYPCKERKQPKLRNPNKTPNPYTLNHQNSKAETLNRIEP